MNVRYRVELSQAERDELTALLSGGKHAVRKLKRAQILLAADAGAARRGDRHQRGGGRFDRTTEPNAALCSATWRRRSAKSRAPAPNASSRAKRKRCWSPRPVRSPPAGRARWTLELLADEMVQADRARQHLRGRRCAAGWPRTTSSRGARTCGAFRRWMRNLSPAWRMCSTSTPSRPIRSARWSASTRARPN